MKLKDYLASNLPSRVPSKKRLHTEQIHSSSFKPELTPDNKAVTRGRFLSNGNIDYVGSFTSAKVNIQRKYYQCDPWTLDESIDNKVEFDRRLKLFLHRRKKLELLSFLESEKKIQKTVDSNKSLHKENYSRRLPMPRLSSNVKKFQHIVVKWEPRQSQTIGVKEKSTDSSKQTSRKLNQSGIRQKVQGKMRVDRSYSVGLVESK